MKRPRPSTLMKMKTLLYFLALCSPLAASKPHIVFVMADDMGWGQTGYYNHPVLKTPNLDEMAANGLRFDRFYAGAPVCSPTRATVLTGRANHRTGVLSHGYALRLQEKTLPQALKEAGYATGHFGKWHLDGFAGPGVPILADDPRGPAAFGFDEWLSVTNFFDIDPIMSRKGVFEEFKGDSSEIIVGEALAFLKKHKNTPTFSVIWFGSPHVPFAATPEDRKTFSKLDGSSATHYGELVAMDRALGTLRKGLREMGIAENTLLVFCSDNGGLPKVKPSTTGGLRGHKKDIYEGGLRVPAVIEWPAVITKSRVTRHIASTMDLFPTVAEVVGLQSESFVQPVDGKSLKSLFTTDVASEGKRIPFRFEKTRALTGQRYKILTTDARKGKYELYDLETDPAETTDLSEEKPEVFSEMKAALIAWNESAEASFAGKDYPEGKVSPPDPEPVQWTDSPIYRPFLEEWAKRPEYRERIKLPEK